jgi:hypothetical protein
MNALEQNYLPIFHEYQHIRVALMDVLTDDLLSRSLGGETLTLGALCREMGEVQRAYVTSLKTFTLDFGYRHPDPASVEVSIAALKAWYAEMDAELDAAISAFLEEDLATQRIDRGGGWLQPISIALDIYREALIIFYGKASIYLRAWNVPRPQQMMEWIA